MVPQEGPVVALSTGASGKEGGTTVTVTVSVAVPLAPVHSME